MRWHTDTQGDSLVVYIIFIYSSLFIENGINYTIIAKQTAGLNQGS